MTTFEEQEESFFHYFLNIVKPAWNKMSLPLIVQGMSLILVIPSFSKFRHLVGQVEGLCLNWTPLQELKKEIIRKWPCRKTKRRRRACSPEYTNWGFVLGHCGKNSLCLLFVDFTDCLFIVFFSLVMFLILFIDVLLMEGSIINNTKDTHRLLSGWLRSLLVTMVKWEQVRWIVCGQMVSERVAGQTF